MAACFAVVLTVGTTATAAKRRALLKLPLNGTTTERIDNYVSATSPF
jgi:hypothetical protein